MSELLLQSASDAAAMLRRKEISSRELTGMLFARIDEVNPALNAVVELRRERRCAKPPRPTTCWLKVCPDRFMAYP